MKQLLEIQQKLRQAAIGTPHSVARFFKTGCGQYAEHDRFLGVSVPTIRRIAKQFYDMPLHEIVELLQSLYNEERLSALILLVHQYKKADQAMKEQIYELYLSQSKQVNNWNLVDSSAHLIVGAHLAGLGLARKGRSLIDRDPVILLTLAQSDDLWQRRIAIVATWYFIRKDDFAWTFRIAKLLLHDEHDLIHKATGWMLREAGKKDQQALRLFLDEHAHLMPRTMLRYALEKFSHDERKGYLNK